LRPAALAVAWLVLGAAGCGSAPDEEGAGPPPATPAVEREPFDLSNPYTSRPLANMDRLFAPFVVADLIAASERPPEDVRVLELGIGVGRVLMELRARFPEIELHGIARAPWEGGDPQARLRETAVHFGLLTAEQAARTRAPVLHFHDVDDGDLSFLPSDHFDLIVSQVSFGYIERKDRLIEELWRVLRPGGLALVDVDNLLLMKSGNALPLREFFGRVAGEGYALEIREAAGFPFLVMRKNVARPLALGLEPRRLDFPVFVDPRGAQTK
jgi:SAM-dependent methyltransferase